ncbi:hypothetical protein [Enterococcus avium]|uniref:hypothetical protein n=1 Tax=Enterococcus avium TaxID=33945 RepID=UPI0006668E35
MDQRNFCLAIFLLVHYLIVFLDALKEDSFFSFKCFNVFTFWKNENKLGCLIISNRKFEQFTLLNYLL